MSVQNIMSGVTSSPTTGAACRASLTGDTPVSQTFQATVTGTGAVSATVVIEGSNDGVGFIPIGTISLTDTTTDTDGFAYAGPWQFVRANVTALAGTGATVTVLQGLGR